MKLFQRKNDSLEAETQAAAVEYIPDIVKEETIIGETTTTDEISLNSVLPKLGLWIKYGYLRKLNFLLLATILTQTSTGFDSGMMTGIQSLKYWAAYFNHPHGAALANFTQGTKYGSISILLLSYLIDKFGRKRVIIGGTMIVIVGAALQAGAKDYGMFLGGRILLGFGSILATGPAMPLVMEVAYPGQRVQVSSFLPTSWSLGAFFAALITYFAHKIPNDWSWRLVSLLQICIPCFQLCVFPFAPESPRWLVDKGKSDKALSILAKYHADGDKTHPLVLYEMAEIEAAIELERANKQSSWLDWWRVKSMRRRFILILCIPIMQQTCGNSVTLYLTTMLKNLGITASGDQLLINMFLTLWSCISGVFWGGFISKNQKRRHMFLLGYGGMFVVYTIWTVLSAINQERDLKDKGLAIGVIAMIFIYYFFYHVSAPIQIVYCMEMVPYYMRSKAVSVYEVGGVLVSIFNGYVNAIMLERIEWKTYIVYCVWLVVEFGIAYFFFPETSGRSLEEIEEVFGGEYVVRYAAEERVRKQVVVED